jgi:N-[(2S)-2-amino-2-carboxyethyl]-L-glutamate dehydrogenase
MRNVEILFLSQEDVQGLGLSTQSLTEVLEKALVEHADRMVEMPPKPGVHPTYENTFIHAMPAYLKRMDTCGIKWVSGFPRNYEHQLPNISGLIILNDTQTGIPLAVMDCRWVTTIRTALVSAIALKHCTRAAPKLLAIIGCGLQGRYHARTITEVLPTIETIRFNDVSDSSMRHFEQQTAAFFGGQLVWCAQPEECVSSADVVVTCTPGNAPIVHNAWFQPGATGVGIEGGCAWMADLLHSVDKFIVDDIPQSRYFEKQGDFPGGLPEIYAELGEIVAGRKAGRENDRERILITPEGMAIEDIALAQVIFDTAQARGVGIRLPLMREDL